MELLDSYHNIGQFELLWKLDIETPGRTFD